MASPCTLLSDRNPHSRDSRLKFTAATHTYHIDGVPTLGSVTGLIHSFGRPFVEDDVINGMVTGRNWPRVGYLKRPTPPQLELILDGLDTEEARDLRRKLRSDVEEDDLVLAVRLCIARHPDQKDRMLSMLALSPTEIKDKWGAAAGGSSVSRHMDASAIRDVHEQNAFRYRHQGRQTGFSFPVHPQFFWKGKWSWSERCAAQMFQRYSETLRNSNHLCSARHYSSTPTSVIHSTRYLALLAHTPPCSSEELFFSNRE